MARMWSLQGWMLISFVLLAGCARPEPVPLKLDYPTEPLQLPRDLAAHEWAQMEWWYYTGHLETQTGERYGFELTFFRRRTDQDRFFGVPLHPVARVAYMAHFAVVDESTGRYRHLPMIAASGREAHASTERYEVGVNKWSVSGDETVHRLRAKMPEAAIRLELKPQKPAVLHGERGIVPKGKGLANYYLSYPRMQVQGTLVYEGREMPVTGLAWFDHEFGRMGDTTHVGWDWYSLQLDDRTEYMIYAIRDSSGAYVPESRACRIDPAGQEECAPFAEAKVEVLGHWRSPYDRTLYPSGWRLVIARFGLDVVIVPRAADQEFWMGDFAYWEGSCVVKGAPANGVAYVELAGYRQSMMMKGFR